MADRTDRAVAALEDVVAVETIAPGLLRVVTWSDAYPIDARGAGCNCPDKEYHDAPTCKHEFAALLADTDLPAPFPVVDSLDERPEPHCPLCAGDGLGCFEAATGEVDG